MGKTIIINHVRFHILSLNGSSNGHVKSNGTNGIKKHVN